MINTNLSSLYFQGLLYEIITGVHSAGTDAASSSSAPPIVSTTKSVDQLLSEIAPVTTVRLFLVSVYFFHLWPLYVRLMCAYHFCRILCLMTLMHSAVMNQHNYRLFSY